MTLSSLLTPCLVVEYWQLKASTAAKNADWYETGRWYATLFPSNAIYTATSYASNQTVLYVVKIPERAPADLLYSIEHRLQPGLALPYIMPAGELDPIQ